MKKKFFKRLAVATTAIALIGLATTVGTMAKYMSTSTGTATANVAKWDVAISPDTFSFQADQTLHFNTDTIVPGTSGSFVISVENKGEVSADVTVTLPTTWHGKPEGMTIQLADADKGTKTVSYKAGENTTTFTVEWNWPFDSVNDTATTGGDNVYAGTTISGTFTVTAIQTRPEAV